MDDNTPKWLFEESKHAGVNYADKDVVARYDGRHESFRDYRQEAQKIAAALELDKDSTVLDIGCGTGGLTVHLAPVCSQVYAVDVSQAMISVLREKIAELHLENVTTVCAGLLTYKHEGRAPDAIIVNVALHHLPDFWKQVALCRLHDLLKPGGRIFLSDVVFGFEPEHYEQAIDEWLSIMENLSGSRMAREALIHVRDEFSTWEWVMTGMLERAGFHVESNREVMSNMRAYICSKLKTP